MYGKQQCLYWSKDLDLGHGTPDFDHLPEPAQILALLERSSSGAQNDRFLTPNVPSPGLKHPQKGPKMTPKITTFNPFLVERL